MAKADQTNEGFGSVVPPIHHHVIIWFLQRNQTEAEAVEFLKFYDSRQWKNRKGKTFKNWKRLAWDWIWT